MRRFRLAAAAVFAVATVAAVAFVALPASAATAAYSVVNSWNNGYQANVTIANDTPSATTTWQVRLTFPAGTSIASSWNATQSNSGSTYTFTPVSWNGQLAPGATATFGFVANGTGQPIGCEVNGKSCGGTTPTAPTTTASTPPTTPTTPPTTPTTPPATGTPLSQNGQLHVCGTHLCNQNNKAIQLRGMSTHGLQWFPNCYTNSSLDVLANEWHADLLRIAMYVQEGGYETDPAGYTAKVNALVDQAEARGMYAILDFHTLTPGDPNYNIDRAKTFFAQVSARNAAKKNVIYEIANEPNGVSWAGIKSYAEQVIPVIRANDPDAVVIVGTRGWSSLGVSESSNSSEIINNPVNASNVMYTFHFYAASHGDNYRAEVQRAAAALPIFVTEFGTVTYTGGGNVDIASSTTWLNLLDSLKISYANWTYSDANESSAAFKPGTCAAGGFSGTSNLTDSGAFLRSRINTPDDF